MAPRIALRPWLSLAVVTLIVAIAPAWASHGQHVSSDHPTRFGTPMVRIARLAPAPSPTSARPLAQPAVYLALIRTPPQVAIQFAAGEDSNGNPVNPGTTFAFGLKSLYYFVTIKGAQGHTYREEWIINNLREPQLDYSTTIPFDAAQHSDAIYYASGKSLEPGKYQLNIFLDSVLYKQATAVIQ
jgi:hypothetical protein